MSHNIFSLSGLQLPTIGRQLLARLTDLSRIAFRRPPISSSLAQLSHPSIAQRLPGEIVELILEYYALLAASSFITPPFRYEGYEDSRDYFQWSRGFQTSYHIRKHMTASRDSRQSLKNVILVCRSWYFAGLQHLYVHPTLSSHGRAVILHDVLKKHPEWRLAKTLTLVYDGNMYKRPDAFLSILRDSTALDTLTILQRNRLESSPFDRHLNVMENLTTRLRVIILYGGHDWSKVLKLSFPALEHLRLQYLSANDDGILSGEMPKLQTLQLVQVKFKFSFELCLRIGALPNLQTLDLYLTDHERLEPFSIYSSSMLPNIRHMTVGVLDGISSISFALWRPPPNLVTFTMLVNLTPQKHQHHLLQSAERESNGIIRTLERLKLILADLPKCTSLERFTIVTQLNYGKAEGDVMENARRDCADFFRQDQTMDIQQAVLDYVSLLGHAKLRLKIPTQTMWCGKSSAL